MDRPPLPVLVPLLIAFERSSLDRQPHEVADGVLKPLLLLPVVHHHERVDGLFPALLVHGGMVAEAAAFGAEPNKSALKGQ